MVDFISSFVGVIPLSNNYTLCIFTFVFYTFWIVRMLWLVLGGYR